ncbi:MAG: hypothetical protein RIA69_15790 [Cyclobacteriaceae bacterium]
MVQNRSGANRNGKDSKIQHIGFFDWEDVFNHNYSITTQNPETPLK